MKKKFTVEIATTEHREYHVEAENKAEAAKIAELRSRSGDYDNAYDDEENVTVRDGWLV